jgi:hypothetical protein
LARRRVRDSLNLRLREPTLLAVWELRKVGIPCDLGLVQLFAMPVHHCAEVFPAIVYDGLRVFAPK